jgi:hypothetical protein
MNAGILKPLEELVRAQQDIIQRQLISFYQSTKSDPLQAGAGQTEAIKLRMTTGIAEIAALQALLDTAKRNVLTSQQQGLKTAPNQTYSERT